MMLLVVSKEKVKPKRRRQIHGHGSKLHNLQEMSHVSRGCHQHLGALVLPNLSIGVPFELCSASLLCFREREISDIPQIVLFQPLKHNGKSALAQQRKTSLDSAYFFDVRKSRFTKRVKILSPSPIFFSIVQHYFIFPQRVKSLLTGSSFINSTVHIKVPDVVNFMSKFQSYPTINKYSVTILKQNQHFTAILVHHFIIILLVKDSCFVVLWEHRWKN